MYYPTDWVVGNIDQKYRQILFSTLTGENVEVRMMDFVPDSLFADWLTQYAPTEKLSDLISFDSRFGEKGWARKDKLVYYFIKNNQVAVMIYHNLDESTPINYRSVIEMMGRSFRFVNNTAVLPTQISAEAAMPPANIEENNSPTPSL